ncbi:MAG: 3-deoxy-manno-octulosonate cytidylyltransferase [Ignavibacteriae bacterium]|nr:3-deoxy-manno-octulosonate cytidylyltransferase [Ignavibacteriota bacterium]MCB9214803.1 3-deoxy-manno-octulosonate cytidylyltransferase [Ignavibacteria bacterium]
MSITAIIPARYASTRLPGKPLIEIAGKPMILHVCERMTQATQVERVVVATDDERIAAVVRDGGREVVMTSSDLPSGTDRIAAAVRELQIEGAILNVQGDEPMIDPEVIDQLIESFTSSDADCATPVVQIDSITTLFDSDTPKVVMREDRTALYFSRTPIPFFRDLPPEEWLENHTFHRHVGMYLYRADALNHFVASPPSHLERAEQLEQLRMLSLGMSILCVEVNYQGQAVDSPEDVMRVEHLLSSM